MGSAGSDSSEYWASNLARIVRWRDDLMAVDEATSSLMVNLAGDGRIISKAHFRPIG